MHLQDWLVDSPVLEGRLAALVEGSKLVVLAALVEGILQLQGMLHCLERGRQSHRLSLAARK